MLVQLVKTGRKHERFIEDLGDDIRVTPGFGFYLRPSYCSLDTCKAQWVGLLGIKRPRAKRNTTRSPEAVWRGHCSVLGRDWNYYFFEVFMMPRALAPAGAMRSRTRADVIQPCLQWQERSRKTSFISRIFIPQSSTLCTLEKIQSKRHRTSYHRITCTGQ